MGLLRITTCAVLPILAATAAAHDHGTHSTDADLKRNEGRLIIGHHLLVQPTLERIQSPLKASTAENIWSDYGAARVELDVQGFKAAATRTRNSGQAILLEGFPLGAEETADLRLKQVSVFDAMTRFTVMKAGRDGTPIEVALPAPDVTILGGSIDGDPSSRVLIAHGEFGTMGYIQTPDRMFMISSGDLQDKQDTLVYDFNRIPQEALAMQPFNCAFDHENAPQAQAGNGLLAGGQTNNCRTIRKAIDTDEELLANRFGGNTNACNGYIAVLAAAGTEIYKADLNIGIMLESVRLWETPDPWSGNWCGQVLDGFVDYWLENEGDTPRDLAHLISGRDLGCGIAASLSGLCDPFEAFCLSPVSGSFPYPIIDNHPGNWDIIVFTHEMGHLLGAYHTHQQTPPVDGCGNNDCTLAPDGTIMSYCHLCNGGIGNMRLGFHPQTQQYMNNYIAGLSCTYEGNGEGVEGVADEFILQLDQARVLDVLGNDQVLSCGSLSITDYDELGSEGGMVQLIPADSSNLGRDALNYTPPSGFSGLDLVTYEASDQYGNKESVEAAILVNAGILFSFVNGRPEVVYEGDPILLSVVGVGYELDIASVKLQIINGGEITELTMDQQFEDNLFQVTLPELSCPGTINWRVQAKTRPTQQGVLTFGTTNHVSAIGFGIETFEASEVEVDWTVSGNVNFITSGRWAAGVPDGFSDRNDPAMDFDDSGRCYLTGPLSGNSDVDNGCTSLTSPPFASNYQTECTWAQWWHNGGGEDAGDVFTVELTNNGGASWVTVDVFGPYTNADGGWVQNAIRVSDFVTPNLTTQVRFTACDVGEGSIVEAAVDTFGAGICPGYKSIPGDLNFDGIVNALDLTIILSDWGNQDGGPGDANGDGQTDGGDLTVVLSAWTSLP